MSDAHELPLETDPFQAELEGFWREQGRDLVRGSIASIEKTARQVIAVAGILEGLYFHAVAFTGLRGQLSTCQTLVYLLPVLLLLLSLAAGLLVFFPELDEVELRQWRACKNLQKKILHSKLRLLRAASFLLLAAVVALALAVWVYLAG